MTYKVGLTGGIGAGKTAVSDQFSRLGVPVIDTDVIARELTKVGQPCFKKITQAFDNVLAENGHLDRSKLRRIIFDNAAQRKKLEAILHPAIRAEALKQSKQTSAPYCLIVVPLMFETGFNDLVDRVLVVDIPEEEQRRRVMARDQIKQLQVDKIINTQLDRMTRLHRADDVLNNAITTQERDAAISQLHQKYLKLA